MQLGGEEGSSARGSHEVVTVPTPVDANFLANPGHDPGQVEAWEKERLQLRSEQAREDEQLARELSEREAEVEQQAEEDLKLFEQYEGEKFKTGKTGWSSIHPIVLNADTASGDDGTT